MSAGICTAPSTVTVTEPVGVAVLEVDPDATVIVTTSFAPATGEVVAAARVVFECTAVTVTVTELVEAAYVVSPE